MRCVRTSRYFLWTALFIMIFSLDAWGAVASREAARQTRSATGATQAKHAAAMAAQEQMTGGSGRGADLRAIASPKKGPTSFTGFPSGTLPGDDGDSSEEGEKPEVKRVAMVGDPLLEPISEANIGTGLNGIGMIADHVGYRLVPRPKYRPRSTLEPPYSYYLMQGGRRLKTLFFDHSLKLVSLQ